MTFCPLYGPFWMSAPVKTELGSVLTAPEIIFEPDEVVFAKVIASLDLDKNKVLIGEGIFDTVSRSKRYIDGLAAGD